MRRISLIFCLTMTFMLYGQDTDPVLFTIDDDEVRVSEFKYIYEKNNADKANYSDESLDEYLELYKKFKLKVHEARSIGLDTVRSLQKELEGYRKQLANSYLKDKEISERLINEVVQRMQEDRQVSHIFVSADAKADKNNVLGAEQKIKDIHSRLNKNIGAGFEEMAKSLSQDKASAKKNGLLGYYTAPLPDGFYEFENAMYETEKGKYSAPIRSKMGFHIIKVSDVRPARGEMEIGHILIRHKDKNNPTHNSKAKIDSIQKMIKDGRSFEKAAALFSDDDKTKERGGYLGFFGVNQYEKSFEDAAFALRKNGDISAPVKTKIGYHIIKRITRRDNSDLDRVKKRVEARIKNNDRFSIAEKKLVEDVKTEAGFEENRNLLAKLNDKLDDKFYSYKWEPPTFKGKMDDNLFTLGGKKHSLNEFTTWAKGNVRERLKFQKSMPFANAAEQMYDMYVEETVMAYEEANLERKYPDFKALMREYREGILLFEITKNEVWDKASQDSIGLKEYFDYNRSDYKWPNRLAVKKVSMSDGNESLVKEAHKYIKKKNLNKFQEKYGKNEGLGVTVSDELIEALDVEMRSLSQKPDAVSALYNKDGSYYFYVFDKVVPSSQKSIKEARGYAIADYQDHLEKEWVDDLKKKHKVKVNEKVLRSLIK